MVQWLRLHASSVRGMGSNPRRGTKIPHAAMVWQKKERKKETNLNGRVHEGWRTICNTSLWSEQCFLQNLYVEALAPKVTLFRDRAYTEAIKIK